MERKINYLFKKTKEIEDEELQSHFLNYICIMLSGYLEVKINEIITQCKKNTNSECKKSVATTQNATWCKIKPILALIDINLTLELHNAIIKTDTIDILYRIITNRNDISHGKNITTLTLPKLESDFVQLKSFIEEVENIFLGN